MRGSASGTSALPVAISSTNTINAEQNTDWYGAVRARAGWVATPNLLLFATGGFAYGKVGDSSNFVNSTGFDGMGFGFSVQCTPNVPCLAGASSAIRAGWTVGGGAEWLFDQHWSAKVEYQMVDLGTETERLTALATISSAISGGPITPTSFSALFREQFHVVRFGLNYKFS